MPNVPKLLRTGNGLGATKLSPSQRVLPEGLAIGHGNRTLSWQYTSGWASRDPPGADKLGYGRLGIDSGRHLLQFLGHRKLRRHLTQTSYSLLRSNS